MKPGECVGSGYCCKTAPCTIALARGFPISHWKPGGNGCPSLVWDEIQQRFWCGEILWETDATKKQQAIFELAAGEGCCSGLNSRRQSILALYRSRSPSKRPPVRRSAMMSRCAWAAF